MFLLLGKTPNSTAYSNKDWAELNTNSSWKPNKGDVVWDSPECSLSHFHVDAALKWCVCPPHKVNMQMKNSFGHNAPCWVMCEMWHVSYGNCHRAWQSRLYVHTHGSFMFIDVSPNCSCRARLMNGPACNVIFVQSKSSHSLMRA